jgi:drug/metabolite transporter (DMT)-like permease
MRIPHVPKTTAWGVGLALATALISGVSVWLNGRYVKLFDDPTLLAAVRNGLVGLVLATFALSSGRLGELRALDGRRRLALLAIGVIGGGIPFALFFNGLALSTSPAAALIHKTLFLWVAVLAVVALGERLGWAQLAALGVLLVGTLVLAPSGALGAGVGEAMIVAATLLWAVEVVVVRRVLLTGVSPSLAAAARMVVGSVTLLGLVAASGGLDGLATWGAAQWQAVAITSLLLTGYVATWYGALQRASASLVTSVLVLGVVVTTGLQAWSTGSIPAPTALAGNGLLLAGCLVAIGAVLVRARARVRETGLAAT